MEPVSLIITALAAGASAGAADGLKDDAKGAAKAAYGKLFNLVKQRFHGNASAEVILAEHRADPSAYKDPLAKKLEEAAAGDDASLVAAARAVLKFLDQQGGKYDVTVKDSKGVQVGDGNLQVNMF